MYIHTYIYIYRDFSSSVPKNGGSLQFYLFRPCSLQFYLFRPCSFHICFETFPHLFSYLTIAVLSAAFHFCSHQK